MSRPQASALVHSIQARLKNAAREGGRPFAELLELYAVERFLHRLGRSPHRDHFVLKGAFVRSGPGTVRLPTDSASEYQLGLASRRREYDQARQRGAPCG